MGNLSEAKLTETDEVVNTKDPGGDDDDDDEINPAVGNDDDDDDDYDDVQSIIDKQVKLMAKKAEKRKVEFQGEDEDEDDKDDDDDKEEEKKPKERGSSALRNRMERFKKDSGTNAVE